MSYLGQAETTTPDWVSDAVEFVDPIEELTSAEFLAQAKTDIDTARVKAGLPPVSAPEPSKSTIDIRLLVGLALVGGLLYYLRTRS